MISRALKFASRLVETARALRAGPRSRVMSAVAIVECRACGALVVNPTPGAPCVMCSVANAADSHVMELQPGAGIWAKGRVVIRNPDKALIFNRTVAEQSSS